MQPLPRLLRPILGDGCILGDESTAVDHQFLHLCAAVHLDRCRDDTSDNLGRSKENAIDWQQFALDEEHVIFEKISLRFGIEPVLLEGSENHPGERTDE